MDDSGLLIGRRCRLSSIDRSDLPDLYRITVESPSAASWRYHGSVPPFDQFANEFWSGVQTQLAVRDRESGQLLGLVVAYGYDPVNLHTKFGVVVETPGIGLGIEASFLFLSHLFHTWPIRKVYLEIPEFNLPILGRLLDRFATCEACFTDHLFHSGSWQDQLVYAITRGAQSDEILRNARELQQAATEPLKGAASLDL